MSLVQMNDNSSLYKGLSAFWLKYFKDSTQMEALYSATESLLGQFYLELMEVVLSKSLGTIPVFNRKDWELLIIQSSNLTFDPPVPSSDSYSDTLMDLSITADKVDPTLNEIYISVVDSSHLRESDKSFFPTYGIYNNTLAGKAGNANNWTVVVPSNRAIGASIAAVNRRVISNQSLDIYAHLDQVEFTLKVAEQEFEIVLTPAEMAAFTCKEELVAALNTKINNVFVEVSIDANYLLIQSDTLNLRVTEMNTAATELLKIPAFNFILNVTVPLEKELDYRWDYEFYIQLITEGYKAAGVEYRFPIDGDIRQIQYIMNTIYAPSVILEEGKDYRVGKNYLYFKSNPFDLENIAYREINGEKQLAFWMSNTLINNDLLYKRYGYRFTDPRDSSEAYKLLLRGIMYYYTQGPNVTSIYSALNLIAGIPVSITDGEMVTNITPGKIYTDTNTYEIPLLTEAVVSIGDTLSAFQYLCDAFLVEDYQINPEWFDNTFIPSGLMEGTTTEARQTQKEVRVPSVGKTGYVIGDKDPSEKDLISDEIPSYYVPNKVYFEVEIVSLNKIIPVVVPFGFTNGNAYLENLATDIQKCITQLMGSVVIDFEIENDATFTLTHGDIEYDVILAAKNYNNINTLVTAMQAQLPSSIIVTTDNEDERIGFLQEDGDTLSITSVNITAQIIFGIQPISSFQGILVEASNGALKFRNFSVAIDSLIRISNPNSTALSYLGMKPFRGGSGSMVGEENQPNIAYSIFDSILKYNTFKISFNLGNFTLEAPLEEIVDIVISGKPTYTTPIISPYLAFIDTIEHNPEIIIDPDNYTPSEEPEYLEVELKQQLSQVFTDYEGVRIHYDDQFTDIEYIKLGPVNARIPFPSNPNSNLVFTSKDPRQIDREYHTITVGVENHLKTDDTNFFASPGIYNIGKQKVGEKYPKHSFEPAHPGKRLSGIYDLDKTIVSGTYLGDIHPKANMMFILGPELEDTIHETGFSAGDFLELSGFSYDGNNGDFTILTISYQIEFDGEIVDVLWLTMNNGMAENRVSHPDLVDSGTYALRYRSGNISHSWFLTLPDGADVRDGVSTINAIIGDDKDIFPFTVYYDGADLTWTSTSYLNGVTRRDEKEPDSYYGERFQLSAPIDGTYLIGDADVWVEPYHKYISAREDFYSNDTILIGIQDEDVGDDIEVGEYSLFHGDSLSASEYYQIEATWGYHPDKNTDGLGRSEIPWFYDSEGTAFNIANYPIIGDNLEVGETPEALWVDDLLKDAFMKLEDTFDMDIDLNDEVLKTVARQKFEELLRFAEDGVPDYFGLGQPRLEINSGEFYIQDLAADVGEDESVGNPLFTVGTDPNNFLEPVSDELVVHTGDFAVTPIAGYVEYLST